MTTSHSLSYRLHRMNRLKKQQAEIEGNARVLDSFESGDLSFTEAFDQLNSDWRHELFKASDRKKEQERLKADARIEDSFRRGDSTLHEAVAEAQKLKYPSGNHPIRQSDLSLEERRANLERDLGNFPR